MLSPQLPADAPTLLIIDDEGPLRIAVLRWFSRRGWRCAEAASLADAEQFLFGAGARLPDAIICDQNLPDGTGEALLERLERHQPALASRAILATGEVWTDERVARLVATGCRLLAKPFDLTQLEALVAGKPGGA
jgi:DNA-binding NtrC family response regulator